MSTVVLSDLAPDFINFLINNASTFRFNPDNVLKIDVISENTGAILGSANLAITSGRLTAITLVDGDGEVVITVRGFSVDARDFGEALAAAPDSSDKLRVLQTLVDDNTRIAGSNGDDLLIAGAGKDTVNGNGGDDSFFRFNIGDLLFDGGDGVDTLAFSPKFGEIPPLLHGAVVNLTTGTGISPYGGVLSLSNVENVWGTEAADSLTGNAANNILGTRFAIGGNDRYRGEGGNDTLNMAIGLGGGRPAIVADGGKGFDQLIYDITFGNDAKNVLDLSDPTQNSGAFQNAKIVNIESYVLGDYTLGDTNDSVDFRGTKRNETVSTGWGNDTVLGRGGNDRLDGFDGIDILSGGDGNDTLTSATSTKGGFFGDKDPGADILIGGDGLDKAIVWRFDSETAFSISFANPAVRQQLADGTSLVNIEQIDFIGGTSNDKITGGFLADSLDGGDGNDIVNGGGGDDIVGGSEGLDTIVGGGGNDRINSYDGEGADRLDGGGGIDAVFLARSAATTPFKISAAAPWVIQTQADGTVIVGIEQFVEFIGGSGNDTIIGGALEDVIEGRGGNDRFAGGADDDSLYGDEGNDVLFGEAGNDSLRGSDGNDSLTGGAQLDGLTGGAGADRFIYTLASDSGVAKTASDFISDFATGDMIDLSAVDAIPGGANDAFTFRGTAAFTSAGQIHVVQSGTETIVEVNIVGVAGVEMAIRLAGVTATAITAADFIL